MGTTGQEVKELQTFLNDLGFTVATSGIYDSATAAAVKRFQQAYAQAISYYGGGSPSGIFDSPTMEEANAIISP